MRGRCKPACVAMAMAVAVAVALAAATAAAAAAGPVVYDAQSRQIQAVVSEADLVEEHNNHDERSATALDFAAWDAEVSASLNIGSSSMSQRSSLRDSGIHAAGTLGVETAPSDEYDTSVGYESSLDVTFTLDEARRFDLAYAMPLPAGATDYESELVLTRAGGATIYQADLEFDDSGEDAATEVGDATGDLEPGQYRFRYARSPPS